MERRCGSISRVPDLQAQSPEYKLQRHCKAFKILKVKSLSLIKALPIKLIAIGWKWNLADAC
jgi:hypothetical protein